MNIRKAVIVAREPAQLFGHDREEAEKIRKKLLFICHPDHGGDEESFNALQKLWDNYDPSDAEPLLRVDDIASSTDDGLNEIKTVLSQGDADLLQNEAQILDIVNEKGQLYLYPILESISDFEEVLSYPYGILPSDLITLEELKNFYGDDLDIKHLGWIWRRTMITLAEAHFNGIVHGGVLPNAILIEPPKHGYALTNWYNASYQQSPLLFKSETYSSFYPVDLKKVLPELDTYMAAETMLWLFPNMPMTLEKYFKDIQNFKLCDFDHLNDEFSKRIFRFLGWNPKEFVTLDWINYDTLRKELLND